jgi:hypothetical protein
MPIVRLHILILKISSAFQVKFQGDHESEVLQRKPVENSVILKDKFIFGISDAKVDDSSGLPLFSCLITPEQFTKI